MQQRLLLAGAVVMGIVGLALMVYTQTTAGQVLGPCTFSNGLIHCSAPFRPGSAVGHSSHPLLLAGALAVILGIGLAAWAIIPSRLRTGRNSEQATDQPSA